MLTMFSIAQSTYLQVKGEAGLSVYVNGVFKCKTSSELNGCIIENITPGSNLIKVSKEGYAPYEETVTIKKGEVFAYSVKPFSKHAVNISQEGNTAQTEKVAEIKTGKLVIQSVPIEISLTIPDIEGVKDMAKTKDQWIADKIPAGNYPITFRFNNKTITKTVAISGDNTTSIFINMLNDEFTTQNTLDPKVAYQQDLQALNQYVATLTEKYKFKPFLTRSDFMSYNREAARLINYPFQDWYETYQISAKTLAKKPELIPGFVYLSAEVQKGRNTTGTVTYVVYLLAYTKDYAAAKAAFVVLEKECRKNVPEWCISSAKDALSFRSTNTSTQVSLGVDSYNEDKGYYRTTISFTQGYK